MSTIDPKAKTILLVEDEEPLLLVIGDKLRNCGFNIVTTRSVKQAVEYLNDIDKVDLIWLDHYLAGNESGLDLVLYLKEEFNQKKHIPIFLVSNTSYPEKHQSYLALGVEKYYTKSNFSLSQIVKDVEMYLKEGEK